MDDKKLIDLVRTFPCIYDIKSPDFKILLKKENGWEAIASSLDRKVDEVQQRWKALRDRFVREIKKKKKPTGSAAKSTVPWELLEHMMFLRDFIRHRNTTGNVDLTEEPELQENLESSESQQNPMTPLSCVSEEVESSTPTDEGKSLTPTCTTNQGKRQKRKCEANEILCHLKSEQDEASLYALSVAERLQKLSPDQVSLARLKIEQVLYEVQYPPFSSYNYAMQ